MYEVYKNIKNRFFKTGKKIHLTHHQSLHAQYIAVYLPLMLM